LILILPQSIDSMLLPNAYYTIYTYLLIFKNNSTLLTNKDYYIRNFVPHCIIFNCSKILPHPYPDTLHSSHPLRGIRRIPSIMKGPDRCCYFGLESMGNGVILYCVGVLLPARKLTMTHIRNATMSESLRTMPHYRIEKLVFFNQLVSDKEYFTSNMSHI
jgi:hypothetical protein